MPINDDGIIGRINEYEETEVPDEEDLSAKALRRSMRNQRVVHELRRLNATIVDASAVNADITNTISLHQTVNAHLAKEQKNFTCTLVLCDKKLLLVNQSHKVKRQCTKGPKKYVDFDDTEKNVASMVSPSLEGQNMNPAAPAALSLTVIDTDQVHSSVDNLETFCPDQRVTTIAYSEVDTISHYSCEFQSNAATQFTNQEDSTNPDQELQLIFIPMPTKGFVCFCQWKDFLAAFESHSIFIWVVQMETHVLMAVTTLNASPPVREAIGVENIKYAINQDALPLLAVQLLRSGWQNVNANNNVVELQGMQGYWQIKPLEGNLSHMPRSLISPFLLVKVKQVEEMLPTSTLEHLPMPEEPPQIGDSCPEPEPEPQATYPVSLEDCISFSAIRDLLRELDINEDELAQIFEKPAAKYLNMENQKSVEAVASPLSLSQDIIAEELPKNDKPVITSNEYLAPLVQRTDNLLDTNSSVHRPPAKISRFSNTEPLQQPPNSGNILISNQNEVRFRNEAAGTDLLFKYPDITITKVEKPIDKIKIYPNNPDHGLTNPEYSFEMINKAPEILPKQQDNKELQSSEKVKIDSEKQEIQSNTEANIVDDKQEFQRYQKVKLGIKSNASGIVKLTSPSSFLVQEIPVGCIRLLPKIPNSATGSQQQQSSVIPRKVWKIYPRVHNPGNSQLMLQQTNPVPTTATISTTGEASSCLTGVRLDKDAASALASVLENQKNLPVFGFVNANRFIPCPARLHPDSREIVVKVPNVVSMIFDSLQNGNRFLDE